MCACDTERCPACVARDEAEARRDEDAPVYAPAESGDE